MFNVGGGEILAILVIALIVLGPDKLPNAARQAGKYLNEFRRISSGFQDEIRGAMDLASTPTPDPTPVELPPAETTDATDATDPVGPPNPAEPVSPADPGVATETVAHGDHDVASGNGNTADPVGPDPAAADAGDPPTAAETAAAELAVTQARLAAAQAELAEAEARLAAVRAAPADRRDTAPDPGAGASDGAGSVPPDPARA